MNIKKIVSDIRLSYDCFTDFFVKRFRIVIKWFKKAYIKLSNFKLSKYPIWIPSFVSFIKLTMLFLIIYIITRPGLFKILLLIFPDIDIFQYLYMNLIRYDSDLYQNLISIMTGVGAVTVGLAFFVAQSLVDKNDPDIGRVLLFKSNFYVLLVMEIYIYILLLCNEFNILLLVILVCGFMFVIYSLSCTIRILISNVNLEEAKLTLFTGLLKSYLSTIYNDDKRNLKLIKKSQDFCAEVEKKYKGLFKFDYFSSFDNSSEYVYIKSGKIGDFLYVDSDRANRFFEKMKKVIANQPKIELGGSVNINDEPNLDNSTQIYFAPSAFSSINNNTVLIKVKSSLYEMPKVRREISKGLESIFTIEKRSEAINSIRFELRRLKQRCISYSRESRDADFYSALLIYEELIRENYSIINDNGGKFSREQAESSRNSFFSKDLDYFNWIIKDVYDVLKVSLDSKDERIFQDSLFFPTRLMKLSIERGDHLVFQSLDYFPILVYVKGFDLLGKNDVRANYMIDRSWRYIKELADIYLVYNSSRNNILDKDFRDYSFYVVKMFQELLKKCDEKSDAKNFKIIIKKLIQISGDEYYDSFEYSSDEEKREKVFRELSNESIYGLGSWILYELFENRSEKVKFIDLIVSFLPINPLNVFKLYKRSYEEQENWEFSKWEFVNETDGLVDIKTDLKLALFFCYTLFVSFEKYGIDFDSLPETLDDEHIKFINSNLAIIFKAISKLDDFYNTSVKDKSLKLEIFIAKFRGFLDQAADIKKSNELCIIKNSEVDTLKVSQFKSNVLKNYNESFGVRDLFKSLKLIRLNKVVDFESRIKFGINVVFDKTAFLSSDIFPNLVHLGFDDGFEFGRNIKRGETQNFINELLKIEQRISSDMLISTIDKLPLDAKFVVLSHHQGVERVVEKSASQINFIPKWRKDFPKSVKFDFPFLDQFFHGVILIDELRIPVFDVHIESETPEIYLFDMNTIGEWAQMLPLSEAEVNKSLIGDFEMTITSYTQDPVAFSDTLDNAPKWLSDKGDRENQVDYLKHKVIIHIFEAYEIEICENAKVFHIRLED